jgi:hypothetical protein
VGRHHSSNWMGAAQETSALCGRQVGRPRWRRSRDARCVDGPGVSLPLAPDEPSGADSDRSAGTPIDRTPSCRSRVLRQVVAATNIAARSRRAADRQESFAEMPAVCIMDAGNKQVVILADRLLPPPKHGVMGPGASIACGQGALEKYFRRAGCPHCLRQSRFLGG